MKLIKILQYVAFLFLCTLIYSNQIFAHEAFHARARIWDQEFRLNFNKNETKLSEQNLKKLNELARHIKSYLDYFEIIGINSYADIREAKKYGRKISDQRAQEVYLYLLSNGIPPYVLKTFSYGNERPQSDGSTEELRALDRRVDFSVIGPESCKKSSVNYFIKRLAEMEARSDPRDDKFNSHLNCLIKIYAKENNFLEANKYYKKLKRKFSGDQSLATLHLNNETLMDWIDLLANRKMWSEINQIVKEDYRFSATGDQIVNQLFVFIGEKLADFNLVYHPISLLVTHRSDSDAGF